MVDGEETIIVDKAIIVNQEIITIHRLVGGGEAATIVERLKREIIAIQVGGKGAAIAEVERHEVVRREIRPIIIIIIYQNHMQMLKF